jgi:hypothetical protein
MTQVEEDPNPSSFKGEGVYMTKSLKAGKDPSNTGGFGIMISNSESASLVYL